MANFLQLEVKEPSYQPESAWLEHGPFLMWLIGKLRPRKFVELGSHWGYSYFAGCQAVVENGLATECVAIDTWQGDEHAGHYGSQVFDAVQRQNASYAGFSRLLRKTFAEALDDVEDGSVDLLHVDGRHFYEDVREDFESWIPKLSASAVVLFHDTEVRDRGFGVHRYWAELSTRHPSFNFLHGNGLGVLFYGADVPPLCRELLALSLNAGGPGVVEDFFFVNGAILTERQHVRRRYGELEREVEQATGRAADLETQLGHLQVQLSQATARHELELAKLRALAIGAAEKAGKAETRVAKAIGRRLAYRLAKTLLKLAPRDSKAARSLAKAVERHSPGRHKRKLLKRLGPIVRTYQLAFTPDSRGGAGRTANRAGRYGLTDDQTSYVYVPPAPPPRLDEALAAMAVRPRFSVVMPTYNTPPDLLASAIASLEAQWYPDWELVIVDDCSPDEATRAALRALDDPRIRLIESAANGGISVATNTAIAEVSGDYTVFLDHDDEYTPDCLWELALEINRSGADFLYSDEDKIDPSGTFSQPFFKPDWSPDALMSTMYTCHVSCVRTALLREVGPLKPEYDGAQDWDLILRVTEKAGTIAHIPKVLYHWRVIPGSIAADLGEKPKAVERARLLREEALHRRGTPGRLEELEIMPSAHRVVYDADPARRLSVIIPTRDNGAVLETCLRSFAETEQWPGTEFVIVDNGTRDARSVKILADLAQRPDVKVLRHDQPFNYSELNNIGLAAATGDVILHLNDDTEFDTPGAVARMIGFACLPHIGAVGARLRYPGGQKIQHAGLLNLRPGPCHAFMGANDATPMSFLRSHLDYNWIAVTGACLMVERAKIDTIGGWDERLPVAYNDVDLCFRLRASGLHNIVSQSSRLIHHESISRGIDHLSPEKKLRLKRDRKRLYDLHPALFMHDPYHNPNLHPHGTHFELPNGQLVG